MIGNLTLTVEILGWTGIEAALDGMIALRRHLGINVKATFNGVELFVCRDDQHVEGMVEEYHKELRRHMAIEALKRMEGAGGE